MPNWPTNVDFPCIRYQKNDMLDGGLIRVPDLPDHSFRQQTQVFTISVLYTTGNHDPITLQHLVLFPLPITL